MTRRRGLLFNLILWFGVVPLTLTACNLPGPLHDNEMLPTLVTETERLPSPSLAPTETLTPTPFDVVAAAATDMPGTVKTVIAPAGSPTPENPATATASPTLALTPSAIPEDETYKTGNLTWAPSLDELDAALGFFDLHFEARKTNTIFKLISHGPAYWSNYPTYPVGIQDGFFELEFRFLNCNEADRLGISFRNQQGLHYYFAITCDGHWGFTYYTVFDETIDLTNYEKSEFILPSGEVNRLGVSATGSHFVFFINGHKVGEADENSIQYGGDAGLHVMSSKFAGLSAEVLSFKVWSQDE